MFHVTYHINTQYRCTSDLLGRHIYLKLIWLSITLTTSEISVTPLLRCYYFILLIAMIYLIIIFNMFRYIYNMNMLDKEDR